MAVKSLVGREVDRFYPTLTVLPSISTPTVETPSPDHLQQQKLKKKKQALGQEFLAVLTPATMLEDQNYAHPALDQLAGIVQKSPFPEPDQRATDLHAWWLQNAELIEQLTEESDFKHRLLRLEPATRYHLARVIERVPLDHPGRESCQKLLDWFNQQHPKPYPFR